MSGRPLKNPSFGSPRHDSTASHGEEAIREIGCLGKSKREDASMTEAEQAVAKARDYFRGSVASFVTAAAVYLSGLIFEPPPMGMGSQRLLVTMSVAFGCSAWISMLLAYRKLLWARRTESEALKSLLELHRADQLR